MENCNKKSKSFCVVPFTTLFMGATGENRLCCISSNPIIEEKIIRNDKEITRKREIKIYPKDIQKDVWTSDYFKNIRQRMLNGEMIEECKRCYELEEAGGRSDRQQLNDHYDRINEYTFNVETGNNKNTPVDLDIRPSNLCNLKCRMCFSDSSSLIGKEIEENPILTEVLPNIRDSGLIDWFSNDSMQDQLKDIMPNVMRLKMLGGETTIIQKVHDLLQWCIDNGYNKTVALDVTTNLTNTNDVFFNLITQFKESHICISIDGIGDVNDYIRFPSKWHIIERNIRKYTETELSPDCIFKIVVLSTSTIYNILYIDKLIKWIHEIPDPFNRFQSYRVAFCPVSYPSYQHVNLLPLDKRDEIIERLNNVASLIGPSGDPDILKNTSRLSVILDDLAPHSIASDEDYKTFIESTKIYDKIRNQDIKTALPELYDIFKKDFEE